jgi:flagellar hook-length control protein FliK
LAALHEGADGSSHIVVRLDPVELGQVQIRIVRQHGGTARVDVAVERPDTLHSLQTDVGHLHQMLDRAGLPEQRSVVLHLVPQDTPTGGPTGASGQPPDQGSFSQQGGGRQGRPQASSLQQSPFATEGEAVRLPAAIPPRWLRAGVNITA